MNNNQIKDIDTGKHKDDTKDNTKDKEEEFERIELQLGANNKDKKKVVNNNQKTSTEVNNDRIGLLLKRIGEKSMGYRWMHNQEYNHYLKIDYMLGILQIVLTATISTLTSGMLVGLLSDTNLRSDPTILIALTMSELILSLLLAIVIGIREQGDYKSKSGSHREQVGKYARIYHSIQEYFSLDIINIDEQKTFLKEKVKEFDELISNVLAIRSRTMEKYLRISKDKNITTTEELEKIDIGFKRNSTLINIKDDNNKDTNSTMTEDDRMKKFEFDRWIHNF